MSDAKILMSQTIIETLRKERWFIVNGDDGGNELYHKVAHVLAAEIDKALGGLTRAWAAVWPDDSYQTPWHEEWNFHPNKSARELAEADVAEHEGTAVKSHWLSGWMVTE